MQQCLADKLLHSTLAFGKLADQGLQFVGGVLSVEIFPDQFSEPLLTGGPRPQLPEQADDFSTILSSAMLY